MFINRAMESALKEAKKSSQVLILLGARQVGKTTLIHKVYGGEKTIYLNLDIEFDRDRMIAAGRLRPTEAIEYLGGGDVVVVDEAQRLPESARIIKGWYDSGLPVKCVLLGSAGLDILDRTAEPLTGRNEKFYLTPLLFSEMLLDQSWYRQGVDLTVFAANIDILLEQFLVSGGYPAVVRGQNKPGMLTSLYQDYLFKDVYGLELIGSRAKLQKLLSLIALQVGSEVSISELSTQLAMSRNTVERYLDILEDTFVIFQLGAFSRNPRKELSKKHKIYFWDNGVRNAAINDFTPFSKRSDRGALWENFVVSEFKKKNVMLSQRERLYFWRTYAGSEVDLVVQRDAVLSAYEIKLKSMKTPSRKAFEHHYGVTPSVINRSNYLQYLID